MQEWRGAGVAVPVFGLRSELGAGVGEFADLKGLVDWCEKAGMKMIQLLPVTDTTAHVPTDQRDRFCLTLVFSSCVRSPVHLPDF